MLTEIYDGDIVFNKQLSAHLLSANGFIEGDFDIKNLERFQASDEQALAWVSSISSYTPITKDTSLFVDSNKSVILNNTPVSGIGTYTPYAWCFKTFADTENKNIFSEGLHHTCYITTDGNLKLKGKNNYGQLGVNSKDVSVFIEFQTPSNIISSKKWTQVVCGDYYTIALDSEGVMWSWGLNTCGQLGKVKEEPSKVLENKKWSKIAVGYGTSGGIDDSGKLYLWGKHAHTLLNISSRVLTPTQLNSNIIWQSLAIGDGFIVAIDSNNKIHAWGMNNYGQVTGEDTSKTSPSLIEDDIANDYESIVCTRDSVCALTIDGKVFTWGRGDKGCLGNGSETDSRYLVEVLHPSEKGWRDIASCNEGIVAIDEDKNAYTWGVHNKKNLINNIPNTVYVENLDISFAENEITVKQWSEYADSLGIDFIKENYQTDEHPVVNITVQQARDYCKWLSLNTGSTWRLPTVIEWQSMVGAYTYPWGNDTVSDVNFYGVLNTNQSQPVKSKEFNISGVYDIVGNVSEWVESEGTSVACGSNFTSTSLTELTTEFTQVFQDEGYKNSTIGFRVVKENFVNGHILKPLSEDSDTLMSKHEVTIKQWKQFVDEVNYIENNSHSLLNDLNSCPLSLLPGSFMLPNGFYNKEIPNIQSEVSNWLVLLKGNRNLLGVQNKLISLLPLRDNIYNKYVHSGNLYIHINNAKFNGVVKWDGVRWIACLIIDSNGAVDSDNISFKNSNNTGLCIGDSTFIPWSILSNSVEYPLPLLTANGFKARWCNNTLNSRDVQPDTTFINNTNTHFAKTLVTIKQWKEFLADTGWDQNDSWKQPGFLQLDTHPVVNVNYNDAQEYCRWLTRRTGRVWRLPTSQEWERAAGTSLYSYESSIWPPTDAQANLSVVSDGYTHTSPVGIYAQNSYGLYDMGGNVWEMCVTGDEDNSNIVIKGGAWSTTNQQEVRRVNITKVNKDTKRNDIGFRVVAEDYIAESHPITNISYFDALNYCKWLSIKTNRLWRLPSDSEWDLAAGDNTYPYGESWPPSSSSGNYSSIVQDSFAHTAPVGSFTPNDKGFYDLGGNVWEWVDSVLQDKTKVRGGSWNTELAEQAQTSSFLMKSLDYSDNEIGFRVVCIESTDSGEGETFFVPQESVNISYDISYNTKSNSLLALSEDGFIYNLQNHNTYNINHLTQLNRVIEYASDNKLNILNCTKNLDGFFDIEFEDKENVIGLATCLDSNYSKRPLAFIQTESGKGLLKLSSNDIENIRQVDIALYSNYITLTSKGQNSFTWNTIPFYNTENFIFNAGCVYGDTIQLLGVDDVYFTKSNTQDWVDNTNGEVLRSIYTQGFVYKDSSYFLGINGNYLKVHNDAKTTLNWGNLDHINDVSYDGLINVGIGSNSTLATTTDFVNWEFINLNKKVELKSIAYFKGKYICVTRVYGAVSVDVGTGFVTKIKLPYLHLDNMKLNKIRTLNEELYIGGTSNILLRSTDGVNWSVIKLPTRVNNLSIKFLNFINGIYFASTENTVFWSRNGVDWIERIPNNDLPIIDVFTGNNNIYLLNSNGTLTVGR